VFQVGFGSNLDEKLLLVCWFWFFSSRIRRESRFRKEGKWWLLSCASRMRRRARECGGVLDEPTRTRWASRECVEKMEEMCLRSLAFANANVKKQGQLAIANDEEVPNVKNNFGHFHFISAMGADLGAILELHLHHLCQDK